MVNVAIIGAEKSGRTSLAAKLGKKGTESDVVLYNFSKGDRTYVFADAKEYPKSLKSLVTVLGISDTALLCVSPEGLTAQTGECIVALDLLGFGKGIIVLTMSDRSNPVALEELGKKLKAMTKGTALESWDVAAVSTVSFDGMEALKDRLFGIGEEILKAKAGKADAPPRVIIDHIFNVTGIGCVILGAVIQGTVHVHDQLTVFPVRRETEIRSIQMQDVDVKSAQAGDRIGAALKGVQSKELDRGFIISRGEQVSSKLAVDCILTKFTSGLGVGDTVHIFSGLQSSPARVTGLSKDGKDCVSVKGGERCKVALEASAELAFSPGDRLLLAELNNPKQRFIGGCTP